MKEVNRQELKAPIYLRLGTSDLETYEQVFTDQEYDFIMHTPPKTIVDAGANIGLASIYFAARYPESKIIAIEPEESNFELLKKNVKPYENIIPLQAALWDKNEEIDLVDPGLGKWGFMTEEKDSQEKPLADLCHQVQGMTVDSIIEEYALSKIDILKIDIEGAEKEVFNDTSAWIRDVNAMIVELHERMKSGCNRSFYNGSNGFDNEWHQGENVYLSRKDYLTRHSGIKSKILRSQEIIKNQEVMIENRNKRIENKEVMIQNRNKTIINKEVMIQSRDKTIVNKEVMIQSRDKTIVNKEVMIENRNKTIEKIRKAKVKIVRIPFLLQPIKKYKAYKSLIKHIGKTKN